MSLPIKVQICFLTHFIQYIDAYYWKSHKRNANYMQYKAENEWSLIPRNFTRIWSLSRSHILCWFFFRIQSPAQRCNEKWLHQQPFSAWILLQFFSLSFCRIIYHTKHFCVEVLDVKRTETLCKILKKKKNVSFYVQQCRMVNRSRIKIVIKKQSYGKKNQ